MLFRCVYIFEQVSKQKSKLALTKTVPPILTEVQWPLRGFGSFSSRGVAKREGRGTRSNWVSLCLQGAWGHTDIRLYSSKGAEAVMYPKQLWCWLMIPNVYLLEKVRRMHPPSLPLHRIHAHFLSHTTDCSPSSTPHPTPSHPIPSMLPLCPALKMWQQMEASQYSFLRPLLNIQLWVLHG